MLSPEIFDMVYENDKVVVECSVERDRVSQAVQFYDILVTDKDTGKSHETIEMPDGLMAASEAVANACES